MEKDTNQTTSYLEMIDKLTETIGNKNDEEIENAVVDLATLKEYVSTFEETEKAYINNEAELNNTIINLRKANNRLMRQIAVKDREKEEVKEEVDRINMLNNIF